jgi:hypothetical protein
MLAHAMNNWTFEVDVEYASYVHEVKDHC